MKLLIRAPALVLGAARVSTGVPALAQQDHQGNSHGNGYARGNGYAYGGGYAYSGVHRYWRHHRAYRHDNPWNYYAPTGIFISIPF